jgi:hypothetical protein
MPWMRFGSMIAVFERSNTVHAVDSEATVIGSTENYAYQ